MGPGSGPECLREALTQAATEQMLIPAGKVDNDRRGYVFGGRSGRNRVCTKKAEGSRYTHTWKAIITEAMGEAQGRFSVQSDEVKLPARLSKGEKEKKK